MTITDIAPPPRLRVILRALAYRSRRTWPLLVWSVALIMAQWSVVQFRLSIVAVYTVAAALLGLGLVRRWPRPQLDRWSAAGALFAAAAATTWIPFFSHTTTENHARLGQFLILTSLLAGFSLLLFRQIGSRIAVTIAFLGTIAWSAASIRWSPTPRIDVWVTLQQAADGLAEGKNPYTMFWAGSPGVSDAFTYLPGTAVLLAPGRWLAGDVRWSLLLATLIGLGCMLASSSRTDPRGRFAALIAVTLLACSPGTITQAEQAWTEPLLFCCLAGWALLVHRGHPSWAILPLALGCASKQHLALLLPLLACWSVFGWRRTVATGATSAAFISPWFFDAPAEMFRDTVTFLVNFHPILFANTWFIAFLREFGKPPPAAVTAALVLGTIALSSFLVYRRQPQLGTVIAWLAFVLLIANLCNKQAFYNQFWLVAALLALGYCSSAQVPADRSPSQQLVQPPGEVVPTPLLGHPGTTPASVLGREVSIGQHGANRLGQRINPRIN